MLQVNEKSNLRCAAHVTLLMHQAEAKTELVITEFYLLKCFQKSHLSTISSLLFFLMLVI